MEIYMTGATMDETPPPIPNPDTPNSTLTLKRRVYTRAEFNEAYRDETETSFREHFRAACACSKKKVLSGVLSVVPILNVVRHYSPQQNVIGDILGGLSAGFLHLPQGLGFGLLASLAPVNGIYTSFFPVITYAIFGTCPHISFGTNALIALLTAGVVEREGENFLASHTNATDVTAEELLNYKVTVAMAATFLCGLILLAMGVLRLGFVTTYLSVSFIGGFTTASAIHITTSQISKMLNIKIKPTSGAGKLVKTYISIFTNIANSNPADVVIAAISLTVLLGVKVGINERFAKRMKMPVPIDLILVIIGTMASYFADLNVRFGAAVVGSVPTGMPMPSLPNMEVIPRVASDSFVIAVIVFATAIAMSKLMAKQHDYDVDDNQELMAYGLSNVCSAFFKCFPSTTAPPRTMVLSSLGARSTLNGFPSAIFILVIVLAAGPLFASLPIAVLAAMIVVAIKNLLMQVTQLPDIWKCSKPDFIIWMATFLVGVFIGLDFGIIVGVAVSVIIVVVHSQFASGSLSDVASREDIIFTGKPKTPSRILPGIRVFRFNSMLFFANADKFKKEIFQKVLNPSIQTALKTHALKERPQIDFIPNEEVEDLNATKHAPQTMGNRIYYIVIDCGAMSFIDIAGLNVLKLVIAKYKSVDTEVYLASCEDYVWKTMERGGFFNTFPTDQVFLDVWDAVLTAQRNCPLTHTSITQTSV